MYFTLKMFSGKWKQNITILIKFYPFWFYSKCPSSFWLSCSSSSYMPEIMYWANFVYNYQILVTLLSHNKQFQEHLWIKKMLKSSHIFPNSVKSAYSMKINKLLTLQEKLNFQYPLHSLLFFSKQPHFLPIHYFLLIKSRPVFLWNLSEEMSQMSLLEKWVLLRSVKAHSVIMYCTLMIRDMQDINL